MIVFNKLQQIIQLETVQISAGIVTQGKATVSVTKHDIDTLLFIELGSRDLENGQTVSFSNTYQWRIIDKQNLSLSHLRHNEPIHLVDLVKQSNKRWKSKIPHRCGEDMYQATLLIEDNSIHLKWLINGPKKSIEIDVIYI